MPDPGQFTVVEAHTSVRDALPSLAIGFRDLADWLAFLPPVGFPQLFQRVGSTIPETRCLSHQEAPRLISLQLKDLSQFAGMSCQILGKTLTCLRDLPDL